MRRNWTLTGGALAVMLAALTGCDPMAPFKMEQGGQQAAVDDGDGGTEGQRDGGNEDDDSSSASDDDDSASDDSTSDDSTGGGSDSNANPKMIRVAVHAGVGKKGRLEPGVLTSLGNSYWRSLAKIEFIKVEHAIQLYKADTGKAPQSHEEFMKEIIEANQINLPELQPGQRYIYEPETEQLMVEKPKD